MNSPPDKGHITVTKIPFTTRSVYRIARENLGFTRWKAWRISRALTGRGPMPEYVNFDLIQKIESIHAAMNG